MAALQGLVPSGPMFACKDAFDQYAVTPECRAVQQLLAFARDSTRLRQRVFGDTAGVRQTGPSFLDLCVTDTFTALATTWRVGPAELRRIIARRRQLQNMPRDDTAAAKTQQMVHRVLSCSAVQGLVVSRRVQGGEQMRLVAPLATLLVATSCDPDTHACFDMAAVRADLDAYSRQCHTAMTRCGRDNTYLTEYCMVNYAAELQRLGPAARAFYSSVVTLAAPRPDGEVVPLSAAAVQSAVTAASQAAYRLDMARNGGRSPPPAVCARSEALATCASVGRVLNRLHELGETVTSHFIVRKARKLAEVGILEYAGRRSCIEIWNFEMTKFSFHPPPRPSTVCGRGTPSSSSRLFRTHPCTPTTTPTRFGAQPTGTASASAASGRARTR